MKDIKVNVPTKWSELSQEQLRFLLSAIVHVQKANKPISFKSKEAFASNTAAQVATLCLLKWADIKVVTPYDDGFLMEHGGDEFFMAAETMAAAISPLSWTNDIPEIPVRIEHIDGASAAPADISTNFSFDSWLSCENFWQAYQSSNDDKWLQRMAEILYSKKDISIDETEALGIFYWWASIKIMVSDMFPNFFKPSDTGDAQEPPSFDDMRRSVDSQIRALTKGDITKEQEVLSMDAMRALTELDAQAREYDEINKKYPSK